MSEFDFAKFKINIDSEIDFYAQNVTHPGITVPVQHQQFRNRRVAVVSSAIQYQPLSIGSVLDEDWEVYFFLMNMMSKANDDSDALMRKSINVFCYDNQNNPVVKITYYNPVLIDIGSIDLDTKNTENTKSPLTYTFEYDYFIVEKVNK